LDKRQALVSLWESTPRAMGVVRALNSLALNTLVLQTIAHW
jgi:hypothetical protein